MSQIPQPITGIVASVSATGLQPPGSTTYGINFSRNDGTIVPGTTGHTTILAYLWPDYARVEPERLIGRRVNGLELPSGHIWWMFPEPIAGEQCGATPQPFTEPPPGLQGVRMPPPQPPGGGPFDTSAGGGSSTPIGGGGGEV